MENQNLDFYRTRDLYFASFLLAIGFNLLDLVFDQLGGFFWFVFNEKEKCEAQDKLFQLNKVTVLAKDMAESIKFLKRKVN